MFANPEYHPYALAKYKYICTELRYTCTHQTQVHIYVSTTLSSCELTKFKYICTELKYICTYQAQVYAMYAK